METFDRIDLAILRALQRDGSLGQSRLAEIVGASAASCWRRVRALEAAGALGPIVRLVNPEVLGLNVTVLCYIRLKNHLPETSTTFEDFLSSAPYIVECFAISGEWDYMLRIVATDIPSYEKFLRKEVLANSAVATASSTFTLSTQKKTTELPILITSKR